MALIRASLVRALMIFTALAGFLALAACYGGESYQLPTQAMKQLSPQTIALLEQKNMPKDSPILVRVFKEESELEVWKKDVSGRFQLLKVYPICRWSGDLGPKVHEGDRQAPEGFYMITPDLMQPNSNYYLAINTGFPNAYDKANDRRGALLMIHGDCSSRGCYAMTDEQIGEIYSLARESFLGGQQSFQIQAYPFRMTPANLARHRTNPNIAFWRMIKEGNDHFEVSHLEPKVEVCAKHYVFDPAPPPNSSKPLVFNPTGRCPAYVVAPEIAGPALAKERADEAQYAQLVRANVSVAPIRTGLDGGMNRVFLSQVGGSLPPARVPPPTASDGLPAQPPAVTADNGGSEPTFASRLFGGLFGSQPAPSATQVATTDSATPARAAETAAKTAALKSKMTASSETTAAVTKPKTSEKPAEKSGAPAKSAPQETAAPKPKTTTAQQQANAAAPATNSTNVMKGAQPAVAAGSFDSRWSGLQ